MTVSEHVWIGGGGLRGGGVGGSYQPGVYVPLKALFLVCIFMNINEILFFWLKIEKKQNTSYFLNDVKC